MTEVRFYHLMRRKIAQALPEILSKAQDRGLRGVIRVADDAAAEDIDHALWSFDALSFLPHGRQYDGFERDQPFWITANDDNPNKATMLVILPGAKTDGVDGYDLCLEIFEDADDEAVAAARARWKTYKDAGHTLSYFQQDDDGKWVKKSD